MCLFRTCWGSLHIRWRQDCCPQVALSGLDKSNRFGHHWTLYNSNVCVQLNPHPCFDCDACYAWFDVVAPLGRLYRDRCYGWSSWCLPTALHLVLALRIHCVECLVRRRVASGFVGLLVVWRHSASFIAPRPSHSSTWYRLFFLNYFHIVSRSNGSFDDDFAEIADCDASSMLDRILAVAAQESKLHHHHLLFLPDDF